MYCWMIGAKSLFTKQLDFRLCQRLFHDHDLNDGMIVTNRKTEIGPRARITYHSTVMSGVRVHEHGLLGSMGVATKDIEPYTISVGIPGKASQSKDHSAETAGCRRQNWDLGQQESFTAEDAKVAKKNSEILCSWRSLRPLRFKFFGLSPLPFPNRHLLNC